MIRGETLHRIDQPAERKDLVENVKKLQVETNELKNSMEIVKNELENIKALYAGSNLENNVDNYIKISDMNQLIEDIQKNLDEVYNQTPRNTNDIESLRNDIELLKSWRLDVLERKKLREKQEITVENDPPEAKDRAIPKLSLRKKS